MKAVFLKFYFTSLQTYGKISLTTFILLGGSIMKTVLTVLVILTFISPAVAADACEGVALTVYNDNFAVVRQRRKMDFAKGVNTVKFTDVASAIDPASVNFKSLSNPGQVKILEQNYEYDLVNTSSLLKRFIDKPITLEIKGSGSDQGHTATGILSSSTGNDLIIQNADGINIISRSSIDRISLKEAPADLVTKPTLVWLAQAKNASQQLCQVTYTTGAISWNADYSAILSPDEDTIDLTGWVTIKNQSGAAYQDAAIKLMAGDVRRIQPPRAYGGRMERLGYMDAVVKAPFAEKAFMDYHIYTLNRTSTINNNQVKQIELITPARDIKIEKNYLYQWQTKPKKVQVKIEFENEEKNNLGIPLPKGKVRVFKADDADGTLEFVGEDMIDHTAKEEKLSLYIGDAFDVVPKHTITDSSYATRRSVETHKIQLKNKKEKPAKVIVEQKFEARRSRGDRGGANWTVDRSSHKYIKHDAHTLRFEIKIKPKSEVTLEYTVTETW